MTIPTYTVYQLTLRVPFPCPVLPLAPDDAAPDVIVAEGDVPYELARPLAGDKAWQAEPGRFLWRGGRRSGRFLVEGGSRVTLQRHPDATDDVLAFHFLDMVLAAILQQRGLLVLHANAAVTPAGAAAIGGASGAGKTTTLAALLARGCAMLADDITALRLGPAGRVEALPGIAQLHLCDDAAAGLGQDIEGLPRQQWRRLKAAVPTTVAPAAAPLRALYLLETHAGEEVHMTALTGGAKFAAVQECIYGPLLPQEHPGQFPLLAAVLEQVAVYRLFRPARRWSVAEVAEAILAVDARRTTSDAHDHLARLLP